MNKTPASILSDEEIDALWYEHSQNTGPSLRLAGNNISRFARAIEAKVRTLRAGQPVAWIQPWALDLFRDDKSAYSQPVVPERRSPWEIPLYLGGAGQSEPVAWEWPSGGLYRHALDPEREPDIAKLAKPLGYIGGAASGASPELTAAPQRFALNPDNGMMYESNRGPWMRYVDCAPIPKTPLPSKYSDDPYYISPEEESALEDDTRAALAAGVPTPVQFKPVAKGSKPLIVGEQVLIMAYIPTEK